MKLGFIIPNHPNEKRVALLPWHIDNFKNEIFIEKGFGHHLCISDKKYEDKGCTVLSREDIFKECDGIFSLKVIKPSDYPYIRENQIIVGWTHPYGSGNTFMEEVAVPKNLMVVDLDNIHPEIFYENREIPIPWIPKNFVYKNSYIAGYSSTMHALMSFGMIPSFKHKVAVLGSGNTSQGAFNAISKFSCDIRMFYRKTLNEFLDQMSDFDIIINGIELPPHSEPLLKLSDYEKLKQNALIIDAAACPGRTFEGFHHTSYNHPIYHKKNVNFYAINNSPSIYYREASQEISAAFSKYVYSKDLKDYVELCK